LGADNREKKSFDRAVIARSNVTFTFVCNKTNMPGGVLAERHRLRGAKQIARIAEIPPQQANTGLAGGPGLPKLTIETHANLDLLAETRANLG
jgi:hypothetical protein